MRLFLFFASVLSLAQANSRVRNPISSVATVQNATINTPNHRLTAVCEFDLTFGLRDVDVKLTLKPNHDVLPSEGLSITYLAPDGSIKQRDQVDRLQHKVFRGDAWVWLRDEWQNVGWSRITVDRDGVDPLFEGAFSFYGDHYHIQTAENYARTKHVLDPATEGSALVAWRDSDIQRQAIRRSTPDLSCSSDRLAFNVDPNHPVYTTLRKRNLGSMDLGSLFGLTKRQLDTTTGGNSGGVNLVSSIGSTAGCPSTRRVALVGVATDCTYTGSFNSTEAVRANVISQINAASAIYEGTFNISLGLRNLTVSDATCPGTPAQATMWNQACSDSVDLQARLNHFSAWRSTLNDTNSHWTLLSTCNTGSEVGLAWLGQACVGAASQVNSSIGSGQDTVSGANIVVRTRGANEWQVIAHETGHTFGAVHDCTDQTCADANTVKSQQCCPFSGSSCNTNTEYIMNPSGSQGITRFSPCSIGNICSALGRNSVNSACLVANKQVTTISGQQCGNGIVEDGEECDCGGEEGCGNNPCCDGKTCKFKSGAVCDDANEDCCHNCQFASNGTVCRTSNGPCDPEETCTGTSPTCPADKTAPDGQSCGKNLQCASGQCTSRDQQCKTVMGSYMSGNDTYACDRAGCTLSCASPEFGPNVCYGLNQNFLDGTRCGGDGFCNNGQCKGDSIGGQVKSWIGNHRNLVIGICVAVGVIILFFIFGCIRRAFARRRMQKKAIKNGGEMAQPPPGGWSGWNNPQQNMYNQQGSGTGNHEPIPHVPPPAYTPRYG
ncbi:zincin [Piedraia hortae CBS 480.64]|uniref:Disintegrin and metalloproteinase domain-containing protein B n=1 Tax=Piedraia hortae CBS 480.64 TaxID=1314780 RepID=A0A6A7C4P3_9PEZI|nr:zincin [Piedraia hortae CBS 480.64]